MSKKIDLISIINGIFAIFIGLYIFVYGPIDVRGFAVNRATGIIVGLFGIAFTLTTIFRKKAFQKYHTEKLQCFDCGAEYQKSGVALHICPKCNGGLVEK